MSANSNYNESVTKNQDVTQDKPFAGFSLDELKLTQDFADEAGVKKLITTIPVRKPDRHWFFRINPDPNYQLTVATIELKVERETYIVLPTIAPELQGDIKTQKLFVGINRQKVLFVWPITLPGPDGKTNVWHQVALEAAQLATQEWIRLVANMDLGAYDILEAAANLGEPQWPDLTMQDIVNTAFKNKVISDTNHPVIQQLLGAV
jgi:hypothetical protein